jgi:hypothetical protein
VLPYCDSLDTKRISRKRVDKGQRLMQRRERSGDQRGKDNALCEGRSETRGLRSQRIQRRTQLAVL